MLQIPFYKNRGHRCAQASMKCALEAVNPNLNLTWKNLERITGHSSKEITYPVQVAAGFECLGIKYKYFIKPNFFEIVLDRNKFEKEMKETYDLDCDRLFSLTNYESLQICANKLKKSPNVLIIESRPNILELEKIMTEGIPICLVNFDTFVGRQNHFAGHYLILTDVDLERHIVGYHNTGPKNAGPNQKVSVTRFLNSWNLCFLDYDLIVVDSKL